MLSDYQLFLKEKGLTEALMDETRSRLDVPENTSSLAIKDSPIHGKGMFATSRFNKGDYIASLITNQRWTAAGMLINHSRTPNSIQIGRGATALRSIEPGEEITLNYREVSP